MQDKIKIVGDHRLLTKFCGFEPIGMRSIPCQLKIERLPESCAADVYFFDASCEMCGLMAYQKMVGICWEYFA